MFHQTGNGANIRAQYGTWPGYLSLITQDFDRAGETAWGVKVTYDFKGLGLPGLIAYFWFAQGTGSINPATGLGVPDRREYDFDVALHFRRPLAEGPADQGPRRAGRPGGHVPPPPRHPPDPTLAAAALLVPPCPAVRRPNQTSVARDTVPDVARPVSR